MTVDDGLPDVDTYTDRFQIERREEAQSDSAHALLSVLRQLDLLDDLAVTLMGMVSAELLRRDGCPLKPNWAPVETSPAGEMVPVDYAYRLVHEKGERWFYVSEPYARTAETLSGLTVLVEQGWRADVCSGFALTAATSGSKVPSTVIWRHLPRWSGREVVERRLIRRLEALGNMVTPERSDTSA